MKIAVVEDEISLADALVDMLHRLQECEVKKFQSGEAFLFAYHDSPFDLVFMDIQMQHMNGLQTAKELRNIDKKVAIVFLTNDPSYVFEGYEVDAIRYWLKPVPEEKLAQLLVTLHQPKPYILWKVNAEIRKIYYDEIYYLESEGHYVCCHLSNETLRMKAAFKEICEKLNDDFMLIHRSYCVNVNHVHALVKEGCLMENKECLNVSRNQKGKLQEAIMKKCREDLTWKS